MIQEYFRPSSVEEALRLLSEETKVRKPLGGGTSLSRQLAGTFDVVDLQSAGLDQIQETSQGIGAGAMVRLDSLLVHPAIAAEVKSAIRIDASENIRNMASLGGWLITSDGRSILTTVLLALDANLTWELGNQQVRLGNWLPLRKQSMPGVLLTDITWQTGTALVYEYVARSPKDRPILVVAAARWKSGRTRVALGGFGDAPILAMDGPGSTGADIASRDACSDADDLWATAKYRREVAAKLALRCVERLDAVNGREP
jgi:CO/xanthine dehydrogenase FAD-binding subunit